MDKANRNFDSDHATKDEYGNITAKNQDGLDAEGRTKAERQEEARLDAFEKDERET